MNMRGNISQWKDDKGFGFILPEGGGEKLFFHISSIKNKSRRPRVGDAVLYDSERDTQGRLRAKGVVLDGVAAKPGGHKSSTRIQTEPVTKDIVDYLAILVAVMSIVAGVFIFYQTGSIQKSASVGILLIIAIAVLNRQKKPKDKRFTCARCKKAEIHDKRTIRAWNNGFTKLYCGSCHKRWLQKSSEPVAHVGGRTGGNGCFGVAVVLTLFPIAIGYGVHEWLI